MNLLFMQFSSGREAWYKYILRELRRLTSTLYERLVYFCREKLLRLTVLSLCILGNSYEDGSSGNYELVGIIEYFFADQKFL
jgi:hypothetical protein